MAAMSNYLENKIVDWLFRGQAFAPPGTLYIALFTSAPSDASGGTEVTGNNYSRAAISASLSAWAGTQASLSTTASTGTSGTTSNNSAITFATPSGTWGTITHFGIYDAVSSGNLLFWGALAASKLVVSGDTVSIQPSQLVIQLDD